MSSIVVTPTVCGSGQSIVVQFADNLGNPINVLGYSPNFSYTMIANGAGGTFTITVGSATTSGIPVGSTASYIQTQLAGLSTVGVGHVTVSAWYPYLVQFDATVIGAVSISGAGLLSSVSANPATAGSGSNQFLNSITSPAVHGGPGWVISSGNTYFTVVASGTGLNYAEWSFSGLPTGNYQVYHSGQYLVSGNASTVPLHYFDGTTYRGTSVFSQTGNPQPTTIAGNSNSFQICQSVYVASGSLTILLTDKVGLTDIGNIVVADTLSVTPFNPATVPVNYSDSFTPSNQVGLVGPLNGTWNAASGSSGAWDNFVYYTQVPTSQYQWKWIGLLPGTYNVQVNWSATTQRSTLASYQVYDGVTPVGAPVVINQVNAPSGGLTKTDNVSASITFQSLGTFAITGNNLSVVLTAGSDTAPGVYTVGSAALISLVSVGSYTEATSVNSSVYSSGPPTISINSGSPIVLSKFIWSIPANVGPSGETPIILFPITQSISPSDSVKFTLSQNIVTVASLGNVPNQTSLSCINKSGNHLVPDVPATKTMGVGWNLQLPGNNPVPLYANCVKNCPFPTFSGPGTPSAQTADLYPQFIAAQSWNLGIGFYGVASDTEPLGYPLWPTSGITTIMWDGPTGGRPFIVPLTGSSGTILSEFSGQATNNKITMSLTYNPTLAPAPQFTVYIQGLIDHGDDADSGRTSITGLWSPHTGSGWNSTYKTNDQLSTSTFTWNFGALPAGTYSIQWTWPVIAGATTSATYKVFEGATLKQTYSGNDQTSSPGGFNSTDYNGHTIGFSSSSNTVTFGGGVVTIVLSGTNGAYAVADSIWVQAVGNLVSSTPFLPLTNLRVFPPDPGINPDTPPKFHPIALRTLAGSKTLRTLTLLGANGGSIVNFNQYPSTTQISYSPGETQYQYQITRIQNWTNADGWFPPGEQAYGLFTIAPIGNAPPLPLVNGLPIIFPALQVQYTLGPGNYADFTFFIECIYYNSSTMATNQFAAFPDGSVPATGGPYTIQDTGVGSFGVISVVSGSMPPSDYFELVNNVPGCGAYLNTTHIASQNCIVGLANAYMTAMPIGSICYFECSNEPWNTGLGFPQFYFFRGLAVVTLGNAGGSAIGYAYTASQQMDWFEAQLATQGRGGELKRMFNSPAVSPFYAQTFLPYLNANSKPIDYIVTAPYVTSNPGGQASLESTYASLNAGQLVDCADSYLAYGNFYQQQMNAYKSIVQTQGCLLGGYEGGNSTFAMSTVASTGEYQTIGAKFHPNTGPYIAGYFAILQSYGFSLFNYFDLDAYPINEFGNGQTSYYGVYTSYGMLPGVGDGSDGLHNNLPDIAGVPPSYPNGPNLLLDVSPIGLAVNQWNATGLATTYTIVVPTPNHTPPGVTSGNFTINPNGLYTGTITFSDNGAGGTFAPTFLTWSNSSSFQTFTYTPLAVGTISVSATNSGSLSNPSPVTYFCSGTSPATSYTLTAPTPNHTPPTVASGNFTVLPNGLFTGTITPSDNGAGGLFLPSSLIYSNSPSPQTFTYTPAALGTISISTTNNGSITNPSPVTYICSGVAPATSLSLVGPTPNHTPPGIVSGNFVVTPNGLYTGTVNPTDNVPGGVFSPTVLNYSNSNASQIFTYTPAALGTISISLINSGSLQNPTPVTYVCSGVGPATTYSFTAPVPNSSRPGVASGNFTITPNGLFTGIITPSDDGAGGTFIPIFLGWSNSNIPQTFTYTPLLPGSFNISTTNNGSLSDPNPLQYTCFGNANITIVTYSDPHKPYTLVSKATNNANVITAYPAQVGIIIAFNANTNARYLKFYDKATAPNPATDVPVWSIMIPGNGAPGVSDVNYAKGLRFNNGIAIAIVVGVAPNNNTPVAANDCVVSISYR